MIMPPSLACLDSVGKLEYICPPPRRCYSSFFFPPSTSSAASLNTIELPCTFNLRNNLFDIFPMSDSVYHSTLAFLDLVVDNDHAGLNDQLHFPQGTLEGSSEDVLTFFEELETSSDLPAVDTLLGGWTLEGMNDLHDMLDFDGHGEYDHPIKKAPHGLHGKT